MTRIEAARKAAETRWGDKRTPLLPCVRCLHVLGFGNKRVAKQTGFGPKVTWRWLRLCGPSGIDRKAAGQRIALKRRAAIVALRPPKPPKIYKIKPKRLRSLEEIAAQVVERREQARLYQLNKYKTDPQHMLRGRLRRRLRKMIGERKAYRSTEEIIGCGWPAFKQHIESRFAARMSWQNYGRWHLDHIRPCAAFDLTNDGEVKRCFHFSNLQPLWAKDNLEKRDKIIPFQPQLFYLFPPSDKGGRVAMPASQ